MKKRNNNFTFSYFTRLIQIVKENSELIFLGFCTLVGGVLRLAYALTQLGWWNDTSRDFLVGYHMVQFHEYNFLGPACSGFAVGLYYPPYYYYFIALLIRIHNSPFFVTSVFALFQVFGIIIFYYIAKSLLGKSAASVATFFYTFSTQGLVMASGTISAFFALPFFYLGSHLFIQSIKQKRILYAVLGSTILVIANGINYNGLLITVLLFIALLYSYRKNILLCIILPIYSFLLFCTLNLNNITYYGPVKFLQFFINSKNLATQTAPIFKISEIFFGSLRWIFPFPVLGLFMSAVLIMIFIKFKDSFKPLAPIFFTILIHFFFLTIRGGTFFGHQTLILFPLYLLVIGYLLSQTWRASKGDLGMRTLITYIGVTLFFLVTITPFNPDFNLSYNESQALSEVIISKVENKDSFDFILSAGDDHWSESTDLWYFIEKELGPKLKLIDNYDSFAARNLQPKEFLIVCRNNDPEADRQKCLKVVHNFEQLFPEFALREKFDFRDKYQVFMYKNTTSATSQYIHNFKFFLDENVQKRPY
jgi:hypothetical protein